ALALPAGELPGTTAGQRLGQADLIQYLGDLRADLRSRERTEVSQRLGDRRTDGLAWVQRAIGVLVDHLQPTAQLARVLRREIVDGSALEVGGARAGLLEGADHAGEGGLAGTRLPDDRVRGAAGDGEAHPIGCGECFLAAGGVELLAHR